MMPSKKGVMNEIRKIWEKIDRIDWQMRNAVLTEPHKNTKRLEIKDVEKEIKDFANTLLSLKQ